MKNESSHVNMHLSHCHIQRLRGVRADHAGAHRLPHRHLQLHAAVLHAVHQGGAVRPPPPAPDDPGYHAWWVNLLKVLHFLPAMMEAVMFPCSGMSELSAPTQPSESLLFTFRTSCSCLPSSCSVLRSSQTKLSNTKDRWRRFTRSFHQNQRRSTRLE